jgi:carbon storage regulator
MTAWVSQGGVEMLVLSRKITEAILLDGGRIRIAVLEVQGNRVKLGIEAPREVNVHREGVGFHEPTQIWATIER